MSDDDDELPLHAALEHGARYELIVRILQADPEGASIFDARGELPLHVALRRNAPAEVIESLLDFHPVAITTNAPDGREPMRMALDYADRDDETAVVAVLNRTLREVGGVSHVHAVEEVAVEEVAVDPPLVGDGANRDETEEKVDGSVKVAAASPDPVGFRTPPSSRCLRESFDSAMRSGKAKESADATEDDGKQKKQKKRFGKRFLAGVGKGLRELAVASSAVVVGAALTKLATRELRKPRVVRKWTGALFAAKGGAGKDEADATPADFVEGWKPWFLQTIEPSRFDYDLEYVDDNDELFEEEPSGLLIPVYDYEEENDYGYGHEEEYVYEEETPSGLLIPVHVGDDYY